MNDIISLIKNGDWQKVLDRLRQTAPGIPNDLGLDQVAHIGNMILSVVGTGAKKTLEDLTKSGLSAKTVAGYGAAILAVVNGFGSSVSAAMSNIADGFMGTMKEEVIDLKGIVASLGSDIKGMQIGKMFGAALTIGVDTMTKAMGDAIAAEALGRQTINRDLGITGELADKYRETLVDAYQQTVLMGAKFEDIQEIVKGTSESLGTARILAADTIEDIFNSQKALGVSNSMIAESAAAFEDISVGLSTIPSELNKAGNFARSVGLNVQKFTQNLTQHITLLNQFGFKNGVEGLTKMVAKAQSLRLEMSTVTALAEKVFNPEGAIELAANLNAIGGAFGSFADPLKMMYQATNDIDGLQDSLAGAAASLATFNQQSGRFEINAVNMRKAKAMADALGMSYQDLTNLAVRAAQKQQIAAKVDMLGGMGDKEKEFLTNMAEMKDGKMVIGLSDNIGQKFGDAFKDGYLDITKLNKEGTEKLREEMEKYEREANRKPTEIANDQLTELEKLNYMVKSIAVQVGVRTSRLPIVQDLKKFGNIEYEDRKKLAKDTSGKIMVAGETALTGHLGEAGTMLTSAAKDLATGVVALKEKKDKTTTVIPSNQNKPNTVTINPQQPPKNNRGISIPSKKDVISVPNRSTKQTQSVQAKPITQEKVIIREDKLSIPAKPTKHTVVNNNNISIPAKPTQKATPGKKVITPKPVEKPMAAPKSQKIVKAEPQKTATNVTNVTNKTLNNTVNKTVKAANVKNVTQKNVHNTVNKNNEKNVHNTVNKNTEKNVHNTVNKNNEKNVHNTTNKTIKAETKKEVLNVKNVNNEKNVHNTTNKTIKAQPLPEKKAEKEKPVVVAQPSKDKKVQPQKIQNTKESVKQTKVIEKEKPQKTIEKPPVQAKPTSKVVTPSATKPEKTPVAVKETKSTPPPASTTKPVVAKAEKDKKAPTSVEKPKPAQPPTKVKPVEPQPKQKVEKSTSKIPVKAIVDPNKSSTTKVNVTPKIIDKTKPVPTTRFITQTPENNTASTTETKKSINTTKSESLAKKEVKVDVDIHSSQTLYDDLVRDLLRDNEFIAVLKQKFKDTDY
jgi:hypothetical protein